jgi:hypothetical protein
MSGTSSEPRASIIDAVKTPLGFLVLGLLVVEGTLASLAIALTEHRTPLVWTIIASIFAFIITVVALAVWRPEALRGDRPLQDVYANQFAGDLFAALDGALSNLETMERAEAWLTLADVIASGSEANTSYSKFCLAVAARVRTLSKVPKRALNTPGPIQPRTP